MQATEVLLAHHDELRALMDRLGQVPQSNPGERQRLVDVLMAELSMHEMIEDEIFYPAMRNISALVSIAHAEHRQLSDQLAVVLRTPPGSDRFGEEFLMLKAGVQHHAGKEEREMFPEVADKVSRAELDEIGDALTRRLEHLRGSRLTQLQLRLKRAVVRRTYSAPPGSDRPGSDRPGSDKPRPTA